MAHPRTIVLSDAHGNPGFIESVLQASAYRQGVDRLIFAGDFLDRGSCAGECLAVLESAGAQMLWGNHDLAVLLGLAIRPQNPESASFRSDLYERFEVGEWSVVTIAGDEDGIVDDGPGDDGPGAVLISHAGISVAYLAEWLACGLHPASLADLVNAEFRSEVEAWLRGEGARSWDELPRVLGDLGPLWARPTALGREGYLRGVRQVLGHTPVDPRASAFLARTGLYCVDPGVALLRDPDAQPEWRYAVIEGRRVELVLENAVSLLAS